MNIEQAVLEFLIASEADGLSQKTLGWYRSLLKHLWEYSDKEITDVDTKDMRAYIIHVRNKFDKEDTIHAHIRALHRFWKWCSIEFGITNPMRNVKYPSQPKQKKPKAVNFDDVTSLFQIAGHNIQGKRDRAIIAFLVDTGCRANGVASLLRENLDLDKRV